MKNVDVRYIEYKKGLEKTLKKLRVSVMLTLIGGLAAFFLEDVALRIVGGALSSLSLIFVLVSCGILLNKRSDYRLSIIETKQKRIARWKDVKVWVFTVGMSLASGLISFVAVALLMHEFEVLAYIAAMIIFISIITAGVGLFAIFVKTITFNARAKYMIQQSKEHFYLHNGKTIHAVIAILSGAFFVFSLSSLIRIIISGLGNFDIWDFMYIFGVFIGFNACLGAIRGLAFELEVIGDKVRLKTLRGEKTFLISDIKSVKVKYHPAPINRPGAIVQFQGVYRAHTLYLYSEADKTGKLLAVSYSKEGFGLLMERLSEIDALYNDLDSFYRVDRDDIESSNIEPNIKYSTKECDDLYSENDATVASVVQNLYSPNDAMVASVVQKMKSDSVGALIIGAPFAAVAIWLIFFISSWWAIALGTVAGLIALIFIAFFFSDRRKIKKLVKYTIFYDRGDVFLSQISNHTKTPTSVVMKELKILEQAKLIREIVVYGKTGQIIISSLETLDLADNFEKYMLYYNRGAFSVSQVESRVRTPADTIMKELQELVEFGAIESPIVNEEEDTLKIVTVTPKEQTVVKKVTKKGISAEVIKLLQEGTEAVTELARLRDLISTKDIQEKISEIIVVMNSIFKKLSDEPKVYSQIKRFSSYYLPTTMKLVTTYNDLEKNKVQSENVTNMLEQINSALDSLIVGLKGIYDSLYEHKLLDIESDIAVLESMLRKDGVNEVDKF